jgi:hypothetical protein
MKRSDYIVVGSGPAAWAAVETLVDSGVKPTVIDIGISSESDFQFSQSLDKNGLASKTRFGSEHMYAYPYSNDEVALFSSSTPISGALGGLSTVWGSNIQIFAEYNSAGWGDEQGKLNDAFRAVLSKVPHSASNDSMDQVGEWPISNPEPTPLSHRISQILSYNIGLKSSKTLIGAARNATGSALSGCTLCGKCLTGCPEEIIFSTDYRFLDFIKSGKIEYIRGKVLSYQDDARSVIVNYIPIDTGEVSQINSDKLLVGAGSIASSIVYLRSNEAVGSVELSDTQVFYLPFLSWRHRGLANNSYALAQMFVTTQEQKASGNDFFMSVYESDSSWPERAKSISPHLAKIVPFSVYTRLLAGIGLLSSKDSGKIILTRKNLLLNIELKRNTFRTSVKVVAACLRLSPRMIRLGLLPLPFLVKVPPVGSSYHVGSLSFQGRPLLDSEGRTHRDSNVHFIDGTSLPMLPTGPVTLTVMANAMRIVKNISS